MGHRRPEGPGVNASGGEASGRKPGEGRGAPVAAFRARDFAGGTNWVYEVPARAPARVGVGRFRATPNAILNPFNRLIIAPAIAAALKRRSFRGVEAPPHSTIGYRCNPWQARGRGKGSLCRS